MRTTIKDVAKAAGVSVATASMALNGKKGVNADTRDKVLGAAKKLCYVPDYLARALVTRGSDCIGLMIPEIQNPFYCAIVDIVTRMAEDMGYTVILGITNNSSSQEREYVKLFLSRRVLGVIIVPMLTERPDIQHLQMVRSADIPLVFCTENYDDCDEPVVMCDFELGEYQMTDYLIRKGLRDFCFVSTDMRTQFALLRYKGFVRALDEASIALDPGKVFLLKHPRFDEAYEVTDQLIARHPDAVLCINDIMTLAILKRMMERGIKIPEDISVAGFDDMMFSELAIHPLSTVRQPLEQICAKSLDLLEQKIRAGSQQKAVECGARYLIAPELVIRSTTI